jgi:hypothetical protein
MSLLETYLIQYGVLGTALLVFIVAKRKILPVSRRLALGVILAMIVTATTYYFAVEHNWRPITKSGRPVTLGPPAISAINGVVILIGSIVLTFAKKRV